MPTIAAIQQVRLSDVFRAKANPLTKLNDGRIFGDDSSSAIDTKSSFGVMHDGQVIIRDSQRVHLRYAVLPEIVLFLCETRSK